MGAGARQTDINRNCYLRELYFESLTIDFQVEKFLLKLLLSIVAGELSIHQEPITLNTIICKSLAHFLILAILSLDNRIEQTTKLIESLD